MSISFIYGLNLFHAIIQVLLHLAHILFCWLILHFMQSYHYACYLHILTIEIIEWPCITPWGSPGLSLLAILALNFQMVLWYIQLFVPISVKMVLPLTHCPVNSTGMIFISYISIKKQVEILDQIKSGQIIVGGLAFVTASHYILFSDILAFKFSSFSFSYLPHFINTLSFFYIFSLLYENCCPIMFSLFSIYSCWSSFCQMLPPFCLTPGEQVRGYSMAHISRTGCVFASAG